MLTLRYTTLFFEILGTNDIMKRNTLTMLGILTLAGCGGGDGSPPLPAPLLNQLNDTGVDWAADADKGNATSCSGLTAALQDCATGRDAQATVNAQGNKSGFSFTKISADGKDLPATASSWSCVRDNVTGLMWEVKAQDGGLRDAKWNYTSYDGRYADADGSDDARDKWGELTGGSDQVWAGPKDTGFKSGRDDCGNKDGICTTQQYAKDVNATRLCGQKDWRVPEIEELRSIVHYREAEKALDNTYFSDFGKDGSVFSYYWSNTPMANMPDHVWMLKHKTTGMDIGVGRSAFRYNNPANTPGADIKVRLVRSTPTPLDGTAALAACQTKKVPAITATTPISNFAFLTGGAEVQDKKNKLIWKRCLEGQQFNDNDTPTNYSDDRCTGTPSNFRWKDALAQTAKVASDNKRDWRMPNIKELGSIVERQCQGPAAHATLFPNLDGYARLWSATPSYHFSKATQNAQTGASAPSAQEMTWYMDMRYGSADYTLRNNPNAYVQPYEYLRLVRNAP